MPKSYNCLCVIEKKHNKFQQYICILKYIVRLQIIELQLLKWKILGIYGDFMTKLVPHLELVPQRDGLC